MSKRRKSEKHGRRSSARVVEQHDEEQMTSTHRNGRGPHDEEAVKDMDQDHDVQEQGPEAADACPDHHVAEQQPAKDLDPPSADQFDGQNSEEKDPEEDEEQPSNSEEDKGKDEDDFEPLSEEEEEPSEEDLDSEDDDGDPGHHYSRRKRTTVQRFTPGRRQTRHSSRIRSHALDDLGSGQISQPGEHFSQRYSSRHRRTVDRFNPTAEESGRRSAGGSRRYRASKRSRREVDYAVGEGSEDDETSGSDKDPSDSEDLEDLEDEYGSGIGEKRKKKYEFRDRAQVRVKPPQQGDAGHAAADQRKARNMRRSGGRSRFADVDELPFAAPGDVGGTTAATAAGVGVTMTPRGTNPTAAGAAPAPWAIALSAIGLGPGFNPGAGGSGAQHPNAAIAAAGGAGKGSGGAASVASLEITPLEVDPSISFDQVGGLEHYVRALKEMVFLPLVYPELFERFHVTPPRGVLFYGPPGTGKTLVARALAAHASRANGGRKVSFFMRKGADVLSKWVGESERHLRLLFEEARKHQPSIIFFDEIDGLAPVRSSRSDQIHNSIVSTLLALMDGLDPRGQVVVIGATNRVDALDGALRRPGRFDRELLFPLPGQAARREILDIHTRKWAEPPSAETLEELSAACVGYCGADLKSLCTEASLAALRRRYPQIYKSEHKLLIDPGQVKVERKDFLTALQSITPASHRAAASPGRPLPPAAGSALLGHLQSTLAQLQRVFPPAAACLRDGSAKPTNGVGAPSALGGFASLCLQRPRLLIAGPPGCGQAHLGPALLYALEGLQTHSIGLPALLSDVSARSPEEALVHAVAEARRAAPAVLYLPHLESWWETAPGSLRATLWTLLADLPPDLPLLLLASADMVPADLDPEVRALFGGAAGEGIYTLSPPTHGQRYKFFEPVATALVAPPAGDLEDEQASGSGSGGTAEQLPLAPEALAAEEAARKEASALAARKKYEEDQATLRALRMALRWVLDRLLQARRWESFWEPVDPKEDPKYWEIVEQPMDLSTLLTRVDSRRYMTPAQFLADVALIPAGEKQYWGDLPAGVRHISRACALEDEARALVESAVPAELRAKLEALLAAGGPAPPPEGLNTAMGLQEDGTMPQPLRERMYKSGTIEEGGTAGRRKTRLAGTEKLDDRIVHTDPEAQLRMIKAIKRQGSQQQEAGGSGEGAAAAEQPSAADPPVEQVLSPLAENIVQKHQIDSNAVRKHQKTSNKTAAAVSAAAAPVQHQLTESQITQITTLQSSLAECTGGLSLQSLEEVNAQLGRLAWERRFETSRQAVIDTALKKVDELSSRLMMAAENR